MTKRSRLDVLQTSFRWEEQSNTIRNAQNDVEYANGKLPQYVLDMVAAGEITQWRKYPNTFFVPGVNKGRVVVDLDTGAIGVRYMHAIPKDQYPKFRDTVNKMLAKRRALETTANDQRD